MDYSAWIVELYGTVYESHKSKFRVNGNSIRTAIQTMKGTYLPNPNWRNNTQTQTADFDKSADRCAYLHKYAMVHTGLLCDILQMVFQQPDILRALSYERSLNICSVGGGPGTDIVALLFVLCDMFEKKKLSVTVIDYFDAWSQVFEAIVQELRTGCYGEVDSMLSFWNFEWDYLSGNMLNMSYVTKYKVLQAVKNADIITMVKFISAVACEGTKSMVKKIFENMKKGAMLVFVDNAGGGFDRMIREAACECGMRSVFGPLQHYDYENPAFSLQRLGYTSQSKTKVCVEVWKKVAPTVYNTTQQLRREYVHGPPRTRRAQGASSAQQNIRLRDREVEDQGCCSII